MRAGVGRCAGEWRNAQKAHQTAPWSGRFGSTRPILHFLRHSVRSAARPHFVRPRRLLFEAPSCSMLGREKIVRETISPRWPTANPPEHTCAHYLPDRHSFGVSYILQLQRIVCPDYQKLGTLALIIYRTAIPSAYHTFSNSRELYARIIKNWAHLRSLSTGPPFLRRIIHFPTAENCMPGLSKTARMVLARSIARIRTTSAHAFSPPWLPSVPTNGSYKFQQQRIVSNVSYIFQQQRIVYVDRPRVTIG